MSYSIDAGDYGGYSDNSPVWNGRTELTAATVALAHRNSRRMTQQGYQWALCEDSCSYIGNQPSPEAGTVFTPNGDAYAVWLPGVLTLYPEGRCDCSFFALNAICKHLYFAVEQTGKTGSPTASWEAVEEWHNPNPRVEPSF